MRRAPRPAEAPAAGRSGARLRDAGLVGAASTGAAAALTATAASACCVGPVVAPLMVTLLGAGGAAWAASLKPYAPYLLAGSLLLLAYAFRTAYWSRPGGGHGAAATVCRVAPPRWLAGVLWASAALWTAALAVNLVIAFS